MRPARSCTVRNGQLILWKEDEQGIKRKQIERKKQSSSEREYHSTNLSDGAVAALVLQRVHTMGLGLAIGLTLDDGALAATTLDAHTVDHKALLGLEI